MTSHTGTDTYEKPSPVTIFEGKNMAITDEIATIKDQAPLKNALKSPERTEHVIINKEGMDEVTRLKMKDKKDCNVVLKHVPLWMKYDEKDAEAANKKFVKTKTTYVSKYSKEPFDNFQRDIRTENNGGEADRDDGISELSTVDQSVCEDNGDLNHPDSVVDTDAVDDIDVDGKKEKEEEEVVSVEHGNGYELGEMAPVSGWSERDEAVKGFILDVLETQTPREAYEYFNCIYSYKTKDFSGRSVESKLSDYQKGYQSPPPAKKPHF